MKPAELLRRLRRLATKRGWDFVEMDGANHRVSQGAPSNTFGGRGMAFFAYSGRSCCSIYCLITDNGAPPHEITQYDRLQRTGLR